MSTIQELADRLAALATLFDEIKPEWRSEIASIAAEFRQHQCGAVNAELLDLVRYLRNYARLADLSGDTVIRMDAAISRVESAETPAKPKLSTVEVAK